MAERTVYSPVSGAIVVHENMRAVHLTWAIIVGLTIAGAVALNLFVEITPENRTAATVLTIVAPSALIAWWVWSAFHPARIEFLHEAITYRTRASKRMTTIQRTNGEVEFAIETVRAGGRAAVTKVLRSPDSGTSLPIMTFDWPDIKRACEAAGWTLVGRLPGEPKKRD